MIVSRRGLLSRSAMSIVSTAPFLAASSALADTVTYLYDPLGRVVRATYSSGYIVVYSYDDAGNRTQVIRTDGSTYTATLQITGTAPVNLRDLANTNGYSGLTDASITFQLGSAVTITGAGGVTGAGLLNGGVGIDTGTWPSASKSISLILQISGKVYGGGGRGGTGSNIISSASGAGGDAISCQENIAITVNAGGQVKAGGSGGAGGGGWKYQPAPGEGWEVLVDGGGGGGGFPNGAGGPASDGGGTGAAGTTSGGGAGGAGGTVDVYSSGAGGAGGGAASIGAGGAVATGTSDSTHTKVAPGTASAAGYAIRKNGKTVTVSNSGTITGTVG